jgi:hypothetical protein
VNRYDMPLGPEEMTEITRKVEEAMSILVILKPLLKEPKKLTPAQQRTVINAVRESRKILSAAEEVDWKFRERDDTAVTKVNPTDSAIWQEHFGKRGAK